MRGAKRSYRQKRPFFFQHSADTEYLCGFNRFFKRHLGEDGRDAPGNHGLSRAGRADHEDIVAAAGRNFQSALRVLLPFDFAEILTIFTAAGKKRLKVNPAGFDEFPATQKFNHLGQRSGADNIDPLNNCSFRGVLRRQNQAGQTGPFGGNRHGQCTTNRLEATVQRQLPQQNILV